MEHIEDLREALLNSRAATDRLFAGHADHRLHMSNLCNTALAWFHETADDEALGEAVNAGLAAVEGLADGDWDTDDLDLFRSTLRAALIRRFEQRVLRSVRLAEEGWRDHRPDLLAAAVIAGRSAAADAPHEEPRLRVALSNLSNVLRLRHEMLGDSDDIDEAVALARQAVEIAEAGSAPCQDNRSRGSVAPSTSALRCSHASSTGETEPMRWRW